MSASREGELALEIPMPPVLVQAVLEEHTPAPKALTKKRMGG